MTFSPVKAHDPVTRHGNRADCDEVGGQGALLRGLGWNGVCKYLYTTLYSDLMELNPIRDREAPQCASPVVDDGNDIPSARAEYLKMYLQR